VLSIVICSQILGQDKIDKEYKVNNGETLDMDLEGVRGDIEVEGWDKDVVKLEGEWTGDCELRIEEITEGVLVFSPCNGNNKISLTAKVPLNFIIILNSSTETTLSNINGELDIKVDSADVNVNKVNGWVDIKSKESRLTITNSSLDGKLSIKGGQLISNLSNIQGSVFLNNSTAKLNKADSGIAIHVMYGGIEIGEVKKRVRATSWDGDIKIGSLNGEIKATTFNGNVILAMIGDSNLGDHDIEIDTHNGNIDVTIPETFSLEFEVLVIDNRDQNRRRKKYTLMSEFDLQIDEKEFGDSYELFATGKTGDGKHKVYINVTNGNVTIKKK